MRTVGLWQVEGFTYSVQLSRPGWLVGIENLTLHQWLRVRLARSEMVPDDYEGFRESLTHVAEIGVRDCPDAHLMAAALWSDLSPDVLADWLEDHREQWEGKGEQGRILEVLRLP